MMRVHTRAGTVHSCTSKPTAVSEVYKIEILCTHKIKHLTTAVVRTLKRKV